MHDNMSLIRGIVLKCRTGSTITSTSNITLKKFSTKTNSDKLLDSSNIDKIKNTFFEYDDKLRLKTFPRFSFLKFGIGTSIVISIMCIVFKNKIREYATNEGTAVASSIMQSQQLKNDIKDLINDETFIANVLSKITDILKMAVDDPVNKKILMDLIIDLLKDQSNKKILIDLIAELVKEPDFVKMILGEITSILTTASIDQTNKKILSDFFIAVLKDESLKKTAGDSIWSAGWYAITPSIFISKNIESKDIESKDIESKDIESKDTELK
jgi:uncharacterized protein YejL (UPF0352 family)